MSSPIRSSSSEPVTHFDKLLINECMIDGIHIKGRIKGITAEALFHAAKNMRDPATQDLIRRQPTNLQTIREIGANIQPGTDIYAMSPSLNIKLEQGYITEKQASEILDTPPIYDETLRYHSTYIIMMYSIRLCQLTQNHKALREFTDMNTVPIIEQNDSEVLGALMDGKDKYRSQLVWEGIHQYLRSDHIRRRIEIHYGLALDATERLGYDRTFSSSCKLAINMTKSDGKARAVMITGINLDTVNCYKLSAKDLERIKPTIDIADLPGTDYFKIFTVSHDNPVTKLPIDAMTNEMDTQLHSPPKGSISIDIFKAAGKAVKQECAKQTSTNSLEHGLTKCPPGKVIITKSENLKDINGTTRMLVHATTLKINNPAVRGNYSPFRTVALLQASYESILNEILGYNIAAAEDNRDADKVLSILVPLLGTHTGYNIEDSIRSLSSAMQKYGKTMKEQSIILVLCCQTDDEATKVKSSIKQLTGQ